VLSDNGAVYTGRYRRRGRVALEVTLHARGVVFTHSRPYHPQTCGKVDRVHQTVNKHLATRPPATTIDDLQRQLDAFRDYDNTRRPHRALRRRTPQQAYTARPKAAASGQPLTQGRYRVGTTPSTPTGNSPCATTAACTTSESAAATPETVSDTDDADVLKMIGAIAWTAQDTPDNSAQADRLFALLLNGLRGGAQR
jgi:integrase-like protein